MKKLFIILFFVLAFLSGLARTLIVSPQAKIRTLRQAIQMANDGDTILLTKGIYREGALTITKPIRLIGQGNPVLDGEKKYEILLISGKNILVKGITFQNSGYSAMNDFASIKLVNADRVSLIGNTIIDAYFAIHVSNSTYTTISGNRIQGSPVSEQLTGNGIHLWKSTSAQILNNQITGHRDGIYFEFVSQSSITDNTSEKNIRYGLHFMFSNDDRYEGNTFRGNGAGVAVMYSKRVIMIRNRFEENWGPSAYGLLLKDITDSDISENAFLTNTVGIHMEGSSRIGITHNQFKNNGWAIKVQASCDDNRFTKNNFLGNSFDVGTNGTMMLNEFSGNYWDKYEGYDLNKDGIGDIPYHPVSMYSMIIEQNPSTLILFRSFLTSLLDRSEKAIPGLTPADLVDKKPMMKIQ